VRVEWIGSDALNVVYRSGHGPAEVLLYSDAGRVGLRRGACMQFELVTADGRLFGFDVWDWSMILGGSLLVCFIALLV
jgi:hypothetical protein